MRLEKLIVEQGLLGPDSLARAQHVCAETGDRLDAVITRLGLVSERALASMLSTQLGMPIATERDFPREAIASDMLSNRFLRDSRALPLRMNDSRIEVAFADPADSFAAEAIAFAVQ